MLKCASPDRFSKLVVPTLLLSIVPVFFLPEVFIPWVFETPAEFSLLFSASSSFGCTCGNGSSRCRTIRSVSRV